MAAELFKLPQYKGNETEYEDIIYSYLRDYSSKHAIFFRPKKSRTPVDTYIVGSKSGLKGKGSADGYLLANTEKDFLISLVELESTGNLKLGISQNNAYATSLLTKTAKAELFDKQTHFYSLVYDGEFVYFSKWDISSGKETIIHNNIAISDVIAESLHTELATVFAVGKNKIALLEEEQLIKKFKKLIRGKNEVQKYRAELMTILASIFDITNEHDFQKALTALNSMSSSGTDSLERKINDSWIDISNKVVYSDKKILLNTLYEEIAIPMYNLALDKNIDLYGFFYEELAEKSSKQEDGEYYTPRHIITPIIKKVFSNHFGKKTKTDLHSVIVADPFCGSGGFIYEYTRMIANKYGLDKSSINGITKDAVYGFDVANLSAAKLNMYLVGDGDVNLNRVNTSIGWKHRYNRERLTCKTTADIKQLEKDVKDGISVFLKLWLPVEWFRQLKTNGFIDNNDIVTNLFVSILLKTQIDKNGEEQLVYKDIVDCLQNDSTFTNLLGKHDFDAIGFGNVDFLLTNVPYGTMEEKEANLNKHASFNLARLEINAVKDCVDLLRHDELSSKTQEPKGEGGVAIIVIPYGILETDESLQIRQYLVKHTNIKAVIKLPKYTFAPYTQIQTYVLVVQKKSMSEIQSFDFTQESAHKAFMYISDVDGKANSDKRYPVRQMWNIPNYGIEYIHDDFSQNYRNYDGDYTSKIEKCWDYSFYKTQGTVYNQARLLEKWTKQIDGTFGWRRLEGNKWGWFDCKPYTKITSEIKTITSDIKKKIKAYLEIKSIEPEEFVDYIKTKQISSFSEEVIYEDNKGKKPKKVTKTFFNEFNEIFTNQESLDSLIYDSETDSFTYKDFRESWDMPLMPDSFLRQEKVIDLANIDSVIESQIKSIWSLLNV